MQEGKGKKEGKRSTNVEREREREGEREKRAKLQDTRSVLLSAQYVSFMTTVEQSETEGECEGVREKERGRGER